MKKTKTETVSREVSDIMSDIMTSRNMKGCLTYSIFPQSVTTRYQSVSSKVSTLPSVESLPVIKPQKVG